MPRQAQRRAGWWRRDGRDCREGGMARHDVSDVGAQAQQMEGVVHRGGPPVIGAILVGQLKQMHIYVQNKTHKRAQ